MADSEMKDEESKVAIALDAESGTLTIDEKLFGLLEKPYTVRKLLLTYIESKEFLE